MGGFAVTAGAVPFSDISFAEHTARQRSFRLFELSGSESLQLSYVDADHVGNVNDLSGSHQATRASQYIRLVSRQSIPDTLAISLSDSISYK